MLKSDSTQQSSRFGLDILFLLLLVGLTLAALAAYAESPVQSDQVRTVELVQHPDASDVFSKLVGESGILSSFVKTENYRCGTKMENARCSAWIYNRPDKDAPPTRSQRNRIECSFTQEGKPGRILLALSSEYISAFGSTKDKAVSFNGDVGEPLYRAMEKYQKAHTDDPIFFSTPLTCTPAGNLCTESIGISQGRAESTYAAISCTREWTWLRDHYVESRYGCTIAE